MNRGQNLIGRVSVNGFLWLLTLGCLLPFALLMLASFTDEVTIMREGYSFFPTKFSLAAYRYLLGQGGQIARSIGVSALVTALGTVTSLFITPMLAYSLSRTDFAPRRWLSFIVVFTILFNGGLVPTYIIYTKVLGIKNTLMALLVPRLLMSGFNVLLMRTYFTTSVPPSVLESAFMDGSGEWRTFFQIVLPLSVPIVATVGLFVGVGYWNDWFNGLIYITDPKLYSLQNVLNQIMLNIQFLNNSAAASNLSGHVTEMPSATVRMALATIAVIPILILYPPFQRYFAKGITIGAVKE